MPKKNAIELVETKRGQAICETTIRYDVVLKGKTIGQLWHNMTGYCGWLPYPTYDGREYGKIEIGEKNITAYKMEVKKLNKDWREHDERQATKA